MPVQLDSLDVHTVLQFDWNLAFVRQTRQCEPGSVKAIKTMYIHLAIMCESKPSPACEHTYPSCIAELLIRTIAEKNMTLWTIGRLGQL